jgi:hypothetical protein
MMKRKMATRRRQRSNTAPSVVTVGRSACWIIVLVVASSSALTLATTPVEARQKNSNENHGWRYSIDLRAYQMRNNRR